MRSFSSMEFALPVALAGCTVQKGAASRNITVARPRAEVLRFTKQEASIGKVVAVSVIATSSMVRHELR